MTRYLLDTNILSEVIKQPLGPLGRYLVRRSADICTSIIVVAELEFWLVKRPSALRRAALDEVLEPLEVLPFEPPADTAYAVIRGQLESSGTMIGANDLLIAAQAAALGLTVVTDNERDFRRVPGLSVENWLRA